VGFEPTIAVLERAKTVRALDRSTAAIGKSSNRVMKIYQWGEVKVGYMVGIAQPLSQRAIGLMARVQFSGISSFSMFFAFCTTYVLLFM
jgi:hypothetical protein